MTEISITPPTAADKEDWRRLYEGYATFYKRPMTDAIAERVWRWITAEDNYRARAVYNRLAQRTSWVTYQIDL